MWSDEFCPLSRLEMRGQQTASVAWRDGKLYFCVRPNSDSTRCDDCAVEVAVFPKRRPKNRTSGKRCARIYILSVDRTLFLHQAATGKNRYSSVNCVADRR
jgi:hypothetical protein